ncbi:response regulator [Nibricoccus sp. IMCC34717]|uniref:response regulator n=1 Tax=Nibricoccus sp. IMCC34717 TaxID=3034021 RepID=UPI00384FE706
MKNETEAKCGQRVLVVDDDQMVRDVLLQTLKVLGYEAHAVADGREVLAAVRNFKPDALILDLVMPDRDGFEILAELRVAHADLPVIAMTGGGRMAASQLLRLASMLGATKILPKPFSLDLVDIALHAVLDGRSAVVPTAD